MLNQPTKVFSCIMIVIDERYKRSLIKTMLHRAFRLSSSWKYFTEECERLKQLFRRLRYPQTLVATQSPNSLARRMNNQSLLLLMKRGNKALRIVLPFKDQKSANIVRRQLNNLGTRIGIIFQAVDVSQKLESALSRSREKATPCESTVRCL